MRLVILDRDGVINEDSDEYIKSAEEWIPIPGSLEAITRLSKAGFCIVVATNQSGIARRLFDYDALNRIHSKMHQQLAALGGRIEAIFFCPHGPDDGCLCRKPRTGLFEDIAIRLRTGLEGVPSVGDSLRDIEAAQAVGAHPLHVRTGKGKRTLRERSLNGIVVYDNLYAAAEALLEQQQADSV